MGSKKKMSISSRNYCIGARNEKMHTNAWIRNRLFFLDAPYRQGLQCSIVIADSRGTALKFESNFRNICQILCVCFLPPEANLHNSWYWPAKPTILCGTDRPILFPQLSTHCSTTLWAEFFFCFQTKIFIDSFWSHTLPLPPPQSLGKGAGSWADSLPILCLK